LPLFDLIQKGVVTNGRIHGEYAAKRIFHSCCLLFTHTYGSEAGRNNKSRDPSQQRDREKGGSEKVKKTVLQRIILVLSLILRHLRIAEEVKKTSEDK